ncbi:MAG: hypothetical protein HQM09_19170 [Candidatus Riflebacteria bacterium]|nr:hypothetical protein [Candidatus Riflebacteria bacterium]
MKIKLMEIPSLLLSGLLFISICLPIMVWGEEAKHPVGRYAIPAVPCDPGSDFKEVYLIRNWNQLPHKNQEESVERCLEINKLLGKDKWKYSSRFPIMSCLAFGAAAVADWWTLEMGLPLEEYRNFYNGNIESGCNPRAIEAEYLRRSHKHPLEYILVPVDPIQKTLIPYNPLGYAKILAENGVDKTPDPLFPAIVYDQKSRASSMDGKWAKIIHLNKGKDITNLLKQALHHFGALYVQLDFSPYTTLFPGGHSVAIIGYGVPKDNPGETFFILHDSYGNHPKEYEPTEEGGPSYRYLSAKYMDTVIAFPHNLIVTAIPEETGLRINFLNSGKKAVPIRNLRLTNTDYERTFADDNTTSVFIPQNVCEQSSVNGTLEGYVEADYYSLENGSGQTFKVVIPSIR